MLPTTHHTSHITVVPYLIRRAQENGSLLSGGGAGEVRMAGSEIRRRIGLP